MILVDTSVWIEFLRCTGSPAHVQLRSLIEEDAPLATTDPVVMEILAGAREEDDVRPLRDMLAALTHLPIDGLADFEHAAAIQRSCRRAGQTVRSSMDCLIAAVAIREGAAILAQDRDFAVIASHTGLQLA